MILSPKSADAATNAVASMLNGGSLRIFNGEQGAPGCTLLAETKLSAIAFKPSSNGVAESHLLSGDVKAIASGKASWFAACDKAGAVVFTGSISDKPEDKADMAIDNAYIAAGAYLALDSFSFSFNSIG